MLKIRTGFVSNSSSSSFILAMKSATPLNTTAAVMEFFGIVKGSQAAKVFEPLFKSIARGVQDAEESEEYGSSVLKAKDNPREWVISTISMDQYAEYAPEWFADSDKFRGKLMDY